MELAALLHWCEEYYQLEEDGEDAPATVLECIGCNALPIIVWHKENTSRYARELSICLEWQYINSN